MSNKRPSKRDPIDKAARSVKGKLTSLFNPSRPHKPASIDVGSSSGMATTGAVGMSNLPLNMASMVGLDHAPTTMIATMETSTMSPPTRPPKPSSIDVGSGSDNHMATTDAARSSNLPLNMVSMVGVDHAPATSTEAVPPPIYVPPPASIPAVPPNPDGNKQSRPRTKAAPRGSHHVWDPSPSYQCHVSHF
ncbi:hypothetical protein BYT27DRAFT_7333712 [Phlegmacium glaucopus]|nr:hypothetical protein BYT27DRAFT_7333712 [Phlegmacium glaucopus]